jgi:hypothetical protein
VILHGFDKMRRERIILKQSLYAHSEVAACAGGGAMAASRVPERRQFGRRQTCWHATISSRGYPAVACVVRDISSGGALLEVASAPWLPARFRLVIGANQGGASECRRRRPPLCCLQSPPVRIPGVTARVPASGLSPHHSEIMLSELLAVLHLDRVAGRLGLARPSQISLILLSRVGRRAGL